MTPKDTTPILRHHEDVDLEAGDVFPHLLVLRPRSVHKKTANGNAQPDSTFRLRMVCLVTIASLALMTIVLISQQLISRHLGNQRLVEDHVILEVEMPDQPHMIQEDAFNHQVNVDLSQFGEVFPPHDEDYHATRLEVEVGHGIPGEQPKQQQEIEIFGEDGVQIVKETSLDDNIAKTAANNLDDTEHFRLEDVDQDLDDDYYDEDEEDYDDDYEEDDGFYDEDEYNNYSLEYPEPKPEDFLDALQSEVIKSNISEDQIDYLKAVLNNQNGDNEIIW